MMPPTMTERTDAFWAAFARAHGIEGSYDTAAFGDGPEMADTLAELVLTGLKRATTGLLRDFEGGGEAMPEVGGHVVLVAGSRAPRAVWRTTEIRTGPLDSVDEAFAWDEGEGDRTRADWLRGHTAFFKAQAAREGFAFHDRIETVFERFEVVWPLEAADGA